MTVKTEQDQYQDVCRGEFEEIRRKLDSIDESLRGNGKPGLKQRVDQNEQFVHGVVRLQWMVLAAVVTSVVGMVLRYAWT